MIHGIIKSSFVDYPGEVSFVIFLGGCNFRCPYCHNKSIVLKESATYEITDVLNMLKERTKFIKSVVITGGEPTIYPELKDLIVKIKELGFKVKLDTNGTNPEVIEDLLKNNLLDYIAMDIKNSFEKYELTTGVKVDINKIKKSISIIEKSKINYQFRSTINQTMHTKKDLDNIKSYVNDPEKLAFQDYKYSDQQLVDKDFKVYQE